MHCPFMPMADALVVRDGAVRGDVAGVYLQKKS